MMSHAVIQLRTATLAAACTLALVACGVGLGREIDRFLVRFHREFALPGHIVDLAGAHPGQRARIQIHFLV